MHIILKEEIIIAGFGGQGVLSMGKILAYSGLMENKEVTWMPAYGPEQRGGTANVTVIVSDERISSPILSKYDTAIILNQPSLAKFENKVKPGGVLIYDGYGIINPPTRKDIHVYRIDAMDRSQRTEDGQDLQHDCIGRFAENPPHRINRKCGESPAQNFARASPSPDSDEQRSHTHRYGHHQGSLILTGSILLSCRLPVHLQKEMQLAACSFFQSFTSDTSNATF